MSKVIKFKNSNVNITFNGVLNDLQELENFVDGDLFMNDLYLHHNGAAWFLLDTNKSTLYFINSYALNIYEYLQEEFKKNSTLKFYPSNDSQEVEEVFKSFNGDDE